MKPEAVAQTELSPQPDLTEIGRIFAQPVSTLLCAMMPPPFRGREQLTLLERIDVDDRDCAARLGPDWEFDADGNCLPRDGRSEVQFKLPSRCKFAKLRIELLGTNLCQLSILINGWLIGMTAIGPEKAQGSCLEYWIPKEAMASLDIAVLFNTVALRDSNAPAFHLIAIVLEIGPKIRTVRPMKNIGSLMGSFENLGGDCEFGFVQRYFGIEPVGLFRFATCTHLDNLLALIETDCEGLGAPGSLQAWQRQVHLHDPSGASKFIEEFMMEDKRLSYSFHTWLGPQDMSEEEAKEANEKKVRYLSRKFQEDLEDGEKIWILKTAWRADVNEAFAFHSALNRKGRNRLFWITRTIPGRPSGSVEWIGGDLLRGYSDQPHEDAQVFVPEVWVELCQTARRAFLEQK